MVGFHIICMLFGVIIGCSADPDGPSTESQACPIEYGPVANGTGTPVQWNAHNAASADFPDHIEAHPLCLDTNKCMIVRTCDAATAQWDPVQAPHCHYSQFSYDRSDWCPLNYRPLKVGRRSLCFKLAPAQPWTDQCFADGSATTVYGLSADERAGIVAALWARNVTKVWLPAKRITDYGPIMWRVAGDSYGETVEFDRLDIDLSDGQAIAASGCLSVSVEHGFRVGAVQRCDEPLHLLCLHRFDAESSLSAVCPSHRLTVAYRDDDNRLCYSLRTFDTDQHANILKRNGRTSDWLRSQCGGGGGGDLFSMESMEKAHIYRSLAELADLGEQRRCLFAAVPDNGHVTNASKWAGIAPTVEFVNWAYPVASNGTLLAADRRGKWNWTDGKIDCIACQHAIEVHAPEIVLNFDKRKRRLYLTIYDEEYLWYRPPHGEHRRAHRPGVKCFTNADAELVRTVDIAKRKWHGILDTKHLAQQRSTGARRLRERSKAIYELRLYGDGSGYYWCEGYTMFAFEPIRSAKVVAFRRSKGDVFAVLADVRCERCDTLFFESSVKMVAKQFKEHLKETYKAFRKMAAYPERFGQTEFTVDNVRLMQIEGIFARPNGDRYAQTLFHVTLATIRIDKSELKSNHAPPVSSDHFRVFKLREIASEMLQGDGDGRFKFRSMNSTEMCLPISLAAGPSALNWISAKIGETQPPNELCLLQNGLPVLRSCIGDFLYGGVWVNRTLQRCHRPPKPTTQKLFRLYQQLRAGNESTDNDGSAASAVAHVLETQAADNELLAADVFYLGQIMNDIFRLNNNESRTTLSLNDAEHIFTIYNRLMCLNESTAQKSAALNSTNILLDAFDNIINGIPLNITSAPAAPSTDSPTTDPPPSGDRANAITDADAGIIATQTPNLIVYVIDPFVRNVSGVALFRKQPRHAADRDDAEHDDFTDYVIRLLYANQSSDELLHDANLEIATYVPREMLRLLSEADAGGAQTIDNANNSHEDDDHDTTPAGGDAAKATTAPDDGERPQLKIVISIYYNDRLFREFRDAATAKPAGKIISVSMPGYESNLPGLLPIFVRTRSGRPNESAQPERPQQCGYWNFGDDRSRWSHDGCELAAMQPIDADAAIAMCVCSHLTHYSYLIVGTFPQPLNADEDFVIVTRTHQKALDTITLLGCLLSLLGVCGIAITAAVFRTWRQKASSIVLLQLSAAIAIQMILLCFVNTEYSAEYLIAERRITACIALGALLQYSILVAFSWMLISAYLQFMRYVKVVGAMRSTRFFLKSFLFGWLTPMLPVLAVIIVAPHSYVRSVEISNNGGICYPSGLALYFGLILPIGLIIFANLVVFLLVIHNILASNIARPNKRDLAMAQFRLSVFLFFLLGLSWIFGFLASIRSEIIFSYLFCLTATIQGFVLFVYFIILDPNTRKLWRDFFEKFF